MKDLKNSKCPSTVTRFLSTLPNIQSQGTMKSTVNKTDDSQSRGNHLRPNQLSPKYVNTLSQFLPVH